VRRLSASLLLCAAACAPSVLAPTEADARRAAAANPGATEADLRRGYELYLTRCAGCHALHRPQELAPGQWPRVLQKMAPRAKLGADELELVEMYLVAKAAPSGP